MKVAKDKLEWMASKSLRDCHAVGVDSIVFQVEPTVRAFFCNENHNFWRNVPGEKLSIAIHPHHCDITLVPIFGTMYNVVAIAAGVTGEYRAFKFESPIKNESGRFVDLQE